MTTSAHETPPDLQPSALPRFMTQAQYARHRGVVRQAVNQAVREGRIKLTSAKRINVAAADAAWVSSRDATRGGDRRTPEQIAARRALTAALPSPRSRVARGTGDTGSVSPPPEQTDPERNGDAESATRTRVAAQVTRIEWQSKLAELEFKRENGDLLERAEVLKAIDEVMRAVRDRLLGVPARVSSIVAALHVPSEVDKVLTDEIRQALEDLARLGSQWNSAP